jgi:hypothetical protein
VRRQRESQEVLGEIIRTINKCPEKYDILRRVATLLVAFDSDKQRKALDLYSEWHEKEGGAFAPDRSRIEDEMRRLQKVGHSRQTEEVREFPQRGFGGFGKSRSRMDDFMEDMERARMARDIARWTNPPSEGEY